MNYVLDDLPSPPGSAYPGARPGQAGYDQDQRPYGRATDQRQGLPLVHFRYIW